MFTLQISNEYIIAYGVWIGVLAVVYIVLSFRENEKETDKEIVKEIEMPSPN